MTEVLDFNAYTLPSHKANDRAIPILYEAALQIFVKFNTFLQREDPLIPIIYAFFLDQTS